MIEPVIDAFTTSMSPACSAKNAMISSAMFPKVALRMPPTWGPVSDPRRSVEMPDDPGEPEDRRCRSHEDDRLVGVEAEIQHDGDDARHQREQQEPSSERREGADDGQAGPGARCGGRSGGRSHADMLPSREAAVRPRAASCGTRDSHAGCTVADMAILAALFAFGSRFVGKILMTALGWASTLLFGRVPAKRQYLLLGITFGSVIWIVLLAGVLFPDVGTFLLAVHPGSGHRPRGR